jgi:hypothetical protein
MSVTVTDSHRRGCGGGRRISPRDVVLQSHDNPRRPEWALAGRPQRNAVGGDAGWIMDPHGRRRRQPDIPRPQKEGRQSVSAGPIDPAPTAAAGASSELPAHGRTLGEGGGLSQRKRPPPGDLV